MQLLLSVGASAALTLSTPGRAPAGPWESQTQRAQWYDRAKAYWEWAAPTNDGVMSNIGPLHDADIADSYRFLTTVGEPPVWPSATFRAGGRALDIGAGIGRVSDALLLNLCGQVDLVDGSAKMLEQARASLGGEPQSADRGRTDDFFCSELQSFVPRASYYDLIWIQCTTMYLTDEDLQRLLQDCQRALVPGGVILLKDNVIDAVPEAYASSLVDGRYLIDEEDASVSRTRAHLLDLVSETGLTVLASTTADLESEELSEVLSVNGYNELHPVAMLALR